MDNRQFNQEISLALIKDKIECLLEDIASFEIAYPERWERATEEFPEGQYNLALNFFQALTEVESEI